MKIIVLDPDSLIAAAGCGGIDSNVVSAVDAFGNRVEESMVEVGDG
jgi:hypothetical protein